MGFFGAVVRGAIPLFWFTIMFAVAVRAQDIGGTIALPDEPFVIPYFSNYVFPDYRSGDVLTQRNDNNRSGASHVAGLNSQTVRGLRRIGDYPLDPELDDAGNPVHDQFGGVVAAQVFAQPLFVHAARIGGATRPIVIVAASTNDVYAFYADGNPGQRLWKTRLGARYRGIKTSGALCDSGPVGIESTPVIDLPRGRLLVSYMTADARHHVAALDLATGRMLPSLNTVFARPVQNWDRMHRNRASLLLVDDILYVAVAGLCGEPPVQGQNFYGSIFAFRASDLANLGHFVVPTGRSDGGGIWQGSTGLAADTIGNLYFSTGNPAHFDLADPHVEDPSMTDSVLRLSVDRSHAQDRGQVEFAIADYFTPYRKVWLDFNDMDVASAGVLLIPRTRYLVAGGKEGVLYALDRADFGHRDETVGAIPWRASDIAVFTSDQRFDGNPKFLSDDPSLDHAHQKFLAGINQYEAPRCGDPHQPCFFGDFNHRALDRWLPWPHIHGTPAFARFRDDAQFLYVWPEKDRLKRFEWKGDRFDTSPRESQAIAPPVPLGAENSFPGSRCPYHPNAGTDCVNFWGNGMPGGMVSVNVDGDSGKGVVFATLERCAENPQSAGFPCTYQLVGSLRAFDPFTLEEVWNDCGFGPAPADCTLGAERPAGFYFFAKFVPPTIAGGRIYVPTAPPPFAANDPNPGKVIVYGK